MQQHKKGVRISSNNNRCTKHHGRFTQHKSYTYQHAPQYHVFIFHPRHNQSSIKCYSSYSKSPITMLFIIFKITQTHTRVFNNTQTSHMHNYHIMQCNIDSTYTCRRDSTNDSSYEPGPPSEPRAPTLSSNPPL